MEYAYKNGANHSDQSYIAVKGFKKAYLKDWTNSLSNRPDGATDVPAGVSPLIGYFNASFICIILDLLIMRIRHYMKGTSSFSKTTTANSSNDTFSCFRLITRH